MKKKLLVSIITIALAVTMLAGCGNSEKNEETSDATVDNSANDVEEAEDTAADASDIDMSNVKLINDGVLTVGAEIG